MTLLEIQNPCLAPLKGWLLNKAPTFPQEEINNRRENTDDARSGHFMNTIMVNYFEGE
jgi:hypothetical protein